MSLACILFEVESDQVTLDLSSKPSDPIRILSNMNLVWYGIYKFGLFDGEIDIYMVVANEPT